MSSTLSDTAGPRALTAAADVALSALERDIAAAVRRAPALGSDGQQPRHLPTGGKLSGSVPACVFVPGRFGTLRLYTRDEHWDIHLYLATRDVAVYSVEHRPTPAQAGGSGAPWSTATCVADIGAYLAAIGTRPVVLVGHSMGAFLCYLVAFAWPELVAGIVARDGGVVSPIRHPTADILRVARDLADARRTGAWEPAFGTSHRLQTLAGEAAAGRPDATRSLRRVLAMSPAGRDGCMVAPEGGPDVLRTAAHYLGSLRQTWPRQQTLRVRLIAVVGPGSWADRSLARLRGHNVPVFAALGAAGGADRLRHTVESADPAAEVRVVPHYGHLDVLLGPGAHREVFEPVMRWLAARGRPA